MNRGTGTSVRARPAAPAAVLLDAGGVLLGPDTERLEGAFARSEVPPPDADRLERALHRAAAGFSIEVDVEADWAGAWQRYLDELVVACVEHLDGPVDLDEIHRHVDSEFADAALWSTPIPGARDAVARLAGAGIRLGVISNADGVMAQRLAERGIVQVGPGEGVPVECVIDSGEVGVMKPDPRIFRIALEALGLSADAVWYVGDMPAFDVVGARRAEIRPWLIDPSDLHGGRGYDRVTSLGELADIVDDAVGFDRHATG